MIYRVLLDGEDIYNPREKQNTLIGPELNVELNTAGSFEFTLHTSHPYYNLVRPLKSIIEVLEDEVLLWFGRPVEINTNFYKQKTVYCEGAFAFFNDSVQPLHEYDSISLSDFFEIVIENHNAQVDESRQFTIGTVSIPDRLVYRKLNRDSTFDVLKRQCLNSEGGYFFFRRENGVNYIDWYGEMPYMTNQPAELGLNLLNVSSEFDMTEYCTCILPLGDEVDGETLTVASVNNGSEIIESDAVAEYGRITKSVVFSGVTNPQTLYDDGVEYLKAKQTDNITIECSAAELHWQNEEYTQFRIGQKIHAHSVPHGIDMYFDLLKLHVLLDTTEKNITLGTVKKPTLAEITKETSNSLSDSNNNIIGISDQINEIKDTVSTVVDVPDPDDIKDDVKKNLDDISGLLDDEEFRNSIDQKLSDGDLDEWLREHGVDDDQIGDVSADDVVSFINDDLNSITDGLDNVASYDDISGINDDLSNYWNSNQSIFDTDSGGSSGSSSGYSTISDNIANITNKIEAATDQNTKEIYELKAKVIELEKRIDNLRNYNELMSQWEKKTDKRMTEIEELLRAVAIDAWIHTINGEQVEVGRVDFITQV